MVEKKRSEVKRWEMGQKSLIYAFVARGTVILAEYTEFSGNFNSIAFQCLQKLPATNNKFTYNCDGHTFNYLVNSLNKEFGSKLKEHMQYCVDHPEEIGKLAKVKAQVSEVKGVMMENIEKVLDRGEKIELLVDKTETLHHQAQDIRNVGTKMRRKMWLQNMKVRLREERRETTTGARGRSAGARGRSAGARGRSAGPRARAESVDARAVAGRGDHRRGRSLGRGRGDRRSQSRVRCESPEGWVLGAPGITTERTTLAQGLKDYWMRKQRIDKEKKESKYFGIVEKECDEEEKKGMFMKLAKEKKNNQSSWIWSDPAAVIGCSVGNSDTTKKNAAEKNINAAGKNTDAAAETSPSSDTEKHDMFNFDKKQDLFD